MNDSGTNPSKFRSVGTVAGAIAGNFISSQPIILGTFGVFLLPVSTAIGWTRTEFSSLLLILSALGLAGYPLAGRLADKWGARPVLLVGNLLFAAGVFAFSTFAHGHLQTGAIFGFASLVSCASSTVVLNKLLSEQIDTHQGLAFGLAAGSGVSLGYIVLPLVAEHVIASDSWQSAYRMLALLVFAIGQFSFWLLIPRQRRRPTAGGPALQTGGQSARKAFVSPLFWLIVVAMCLASVAISSLIAHNVAMAADRGVKATVAVLMLSAGAAANAIWQPVAGAFLDRVKGPRLMAPFMLLAVGGLLLISRASTAAEFMIGGVLLGIASGSEYGFVPIALRRYFGEKAFAEIYGLVFAISIVSHTTGPLILAATFDNTGSYTIGLRMMAGALTLAATIIFILPRFADAEEKLPAASVRPGGESDAITYTN